MAAQWLRWNLTTHIFEYSTDNGASFLPLPLDASILSQGTLDPARIPGGSGASLSGPNVWTGVNKYSSAAPFVQFNETDQGVNLKNWDIGADAALFRIRTLTDALASPATLFQLDRNGNITLTTSGAGNHIFFSSIDAASYVKVSNLSAGGSAQAGVHFRNDAGDDRALIVATSSGNANIAHTPDALCLWSQGIGGISINGSVGPILLKTGNTVRVTIATSGQVTFASGVTFSGAVTAAQITSSVDIFAANFRASNAVVAQGAVYSYNSPMGLWNPVAYSAGYFVSASGVWTVEAADMVTFAYTTVGKMMTVVFEILNSSQSAATGELRITIPGGVAVTRAATSVGFSAGHSGDPAINTFCSVTVSPGVAYIKIMPTVPSTGAAANFNAITNGLDIRGQITFQIN